MNFTKNHVTAIILCIAISGLVFCLLQFSLLDSWQEKLLDRFFTKKSPSNEMVIFAIDNESISAIGQWPWKRSIFASALQKLQTAKVVGIDVNFSEASVNPQEDAALANAINGSVPKIILPVQINQKTLEKTEPLAIFKQKSQLGVVNVSTQDGVVRFVENKQGGLQSFGAVVVAQYKEALHVPGHMRIDYAGPEGTFVTLPINDLLKGNVPESIYNNKIVLIGATAPDLHDFFETPFGQVSGVQINANIISTILSQKFYRDLPWYLSLLTILICAGFAGWCAVSIKKIGWLVIVLAGFFAAINAAAMLLFYWHLIIPVLYLNVAFLAATAILVMHQYVTESKEKKLIYESFKYYLSPEIIQEIIKDPSKLKLGGEKKKITVFFSDIRGFSGMSEILTPEQLTHALSEYMTEMTDIIMDHKGLVAQYFGDGIMAFWGAPIQNASQAEDACRSCVAMIRALKPLNERLAKEGITTPIKIGVGVNTAQVIAGNIGSKKKFNYTVFGDGVNLSSRLEGLNKEYGTSIIISEATKKDLSAGRQELEHNPEFLLRQLDTIVVKGKKEPTVIYELLIDPLPQKVSEHFQRGRELYIQGKWQEAIVEFSANTEDGPSKFYLKRCREFLENPPENWTGVYEFKNK